MYKKITKILFYLMSLTAVLANPLLSTPAEAFTVDVKNLYYSDPSPRVINNYDFSAGLVGNPIPPNNIGIPDSFVTKYGTDSGFMFGAVADMGSSVVTLNTASQLCTIQTSTQGGAVLQGASSGTPPTPATSWTFSLALQNFSGVTDPAKQYRFEIGTSLPMDAGPQPRFGGVWNASGSLELSTAIFDEAGNGTTLWSGTTPIVFNGLTPTSTAIELKIVNTGTTVTFSYRLNDGAWTDMPGVYTIASGIVFNSLPARFPYLFLQERTPESPFQVSSQHWNDAQGNVYNAWPRVMDPGTSYSAVTLNSPGYLAETPMDYNSGAGYWSLSGTLFADDFNDNTVDTAKWSTIGTSVTENGGIFKVDQAQTDAGGTALSRAIVINPYAPITVQRMATVHYANNNFDGIFALYFGDTPNVTSLNDSTFSVVVSHANYNSTTADTAPANGFYLGRYPARFPNAVATTSAIWDTGFVEKIVYNPVSGVAELYINGVQKATINLGALPAGARYLKVYLDAWGLNTGHYNYSDDLTVSQPWTGGTVFLSADTPPTGLVTFNFTATKQGGGTESASKTITGYVAEFAGSLLPTGNITNATPTFSWMGITGATFYSVQVSDANGNRIWNKNNIPAGTTSAVYNDDATGPALVSGQTYNYEIVSSIVTGGVNNDSFAKGSFTYTGAAPTTISFNGWVKTVPNWPGTGGMAALTGTTVSAYLPGTPPTLIGTVTADASTGAFTLTGIPKSTTFYLQIQPTVPGYTPVLSKFMNWTADIPGLLPFGLFTMGQGLQYPTGLGITPGTGLILGRVALENSPTTFLDGATVTATQWVNGSPTSTTYPVTYTSGSATQADGIYMVKNVPTGTLVQLVVTLVGHTFQFNGSVIPVAAGVVSEESFFGTATQPLQSPFNAYSYHQDTNYFINVFVDDTSHAFTGVTVNGFGLSGEVGLEYVTARLRWELPAAVGISLGTTLPTEPRTYNFTAATGGTPVTGSKTVSVYVENFATTLQPIGNVSLTPTFTWTGIAGATSYAVVLDDVTAGNTWVWTSPNLGSQTSVLYNGTALTAGHTYQYTVISSINTDGNSNASFTRAQFTYMPDTQANFSRFQVTSGVADDNSPAWSPDGQKIAFTSNRSGNYNIWVVNPNGTGLNQLTTGTFDAKYPSWSPDGTKIAYIVHDPDPNPSEGAFDGYFLYTMNADGSSQTLHPLPPRASQDPTDKFWEYETIFTEWMSNTSVAFVSFGPEGGSYKIYRYDVSNNTVSEITPAGEANPSGAVYKLSWSSVKNLLAFDRWPIGIQTFTPGSANLQIVDIPRATQMDTPSMPSWSTDGNKMAFVKNLYSNTAGIAIYDIAGSTMTVNQAATGGDRWPVWSPDGKYIAIVSGAPGNGDIWILTVQPAIKGDINGDGLVNLTDIILILQVISGMNPADIRADYAISGVDVNGDNRIGLQEVIYILQAVAGLRQ